MKNPNVQYQIWEIGTATIYTKPINIQARYPKERIKDANAEGNLPSESNSSFMSIFHTDIAYHKVIPPERKAQAKGSPYSGQKHGTEPIANSIMQYALDSIRAVSYTHLTLPTKA